MPENEHPRPLLPNVAVVVIGRNEGQRLANCLRSLANYIERTVYVDSGSSDGSLEFAAAMGATVIALDMTTPFTAARARNAGFQHATERWPKIAFVQFIDGDCEIDETWIEVATTFLTKRSDVAIVFGRRRERHPERTIFNALCDREWNGVPGEVTECGGDILARAAALHEVGGYSDGLIAGEEPELCVRFREKGWIIWRLASEMTLHDADITRFAQWWRRSRRAGHAFAEVSFLHRSSPCRIWSRSAWRAAFWAFLVPVSALVGALIHPGVLALLLLYPLQLVRLARRQGSFRRENWRNALFDVLGKFPELQGACQYHLNRLLGRNHELIEYK
jgi:glycosyltransferase involved in cell wall biosynthesis